ncbi:MAG: enoyl-CoA hydratase/isomerase family protein [Acidimicrobiales bacterium]|nr:enoyl-CoA hydratase/isomerase family protein [Acidimicrobiales bacterium]
MADDRSIDEQVLTSLEGGVLTITLNRPEAHNAITPDQRNHLIRVLEDASADLSVRAVILTAVGKGFCTGADLRIDREPPPRPAGAPEQAILDVGRGIKTGAQRLVAAILDCEKPVIAAVNGTAAGIGSHMALACDLVVAAEGVRFIEVFIRRGIAPDGGGAYLLPRLIGVQKAKELMFFGDDLHAEDALAMGLVNRVVPADELMDAARALADRLAGQPTKVLSLTKMMVNRSLESDRLTMFEFEAMSQDLLLRGEDAQEGVAAFKERRTPSWKGW